MSDSRVELQRRLEIPRRGHQLCEALDRCSFLQPRQKGDHRTYRNNETGESITVLNKRRDLLDTNPKVYRKIQKTIARWGVFS